MHNENTIAIYEILSDMQRLESLLEAEDGDDLNKDAILSLISTQKVIASIVLEILPNES